MEPEAFQRFREYLTILKERQVWDLLVEFFIYRGIHADIVHGVGEHGMDVVARVNAQKDFLQKGYYIVTQAKTGKLDIDGCRDVLRQIIEASYYRITHPNYADCLLPRRIVLVVVGEVTEQARNSIIEYNLKHDVKIEVFALNDLIKLFADTGFAAIKWEQVTGVGQPELIRAEVSAPPEVGG
jgi:hypothetical protein